MIGVREVSAFGGNTDDPFGAAWDEAETELQWVDQVPPPEREE